MHTGNSIIIRAPKMAIFETAANLELWPKILPHYRYIRYLERGHDRNLVVMAAVRSGIPISWTSEQIIDRKNIEIHFHHLKAWTKGMRVVWSFQGNPGRHPGRDHARAELQESRAGSGGRADHRQFFYPPHRQQDASLHEGLPRRRRRQIHPNPTFQMTKRRAVITGLGPITCIGIGREDFWRGMRAEKSGIQAISSFDTSEFNAHCGGEIPDWIPEDYFPPHRLKRLDRYAQFAVASAKMALDDAGLPYSQEHPQHRVGVSFGTALGGVANAEYQHAHFLKKGTRGVNQTLALQVFGGSAHSNIAIEFGFRGVGTTNSNSCASGTVAVGEALRYIRDDFADVIVAGGAEAPLSPLTFGAFAIIKTMSQWAGDPALACRPFDLKRDGFVMGEGAASLVIEELEHAQKRGAHIFAEVLGYSLNNDAFHMTSPLPSGESCIRAMRDALADAQLDAGAN